MKVSKSATRTITFDPDPTPGQEADPTVFSDDHTPDDPETAAELCPVCHDLLAWHEQACAVAGNPSAAPPEHNAPAASAPRPASTFAFAFGHRVQPAHSAPAAITWRGQHKEHHPATGLVHRVNVYYLDNGYWDCYREDELQAA